jgi:hypothetical protein
MSNGIATQHGLVGFFDILGYQSFLANNSARDAAQVVADVLLRARDQVQETMRAELGTDETPLEEDLDAVRWLIFSDTIFLTLPYTCERPENDRRANAWRWVLLLIHAHILHEHLFDQGLPVRGAISCGEYYVSENCFVGQPIVEAYQFASAINLSAVVVAPSPAAQMDSVAQTDYPMSVRAFTRDYLTPLRDGREERLRAVGIQRSLLVDDVGQYVYDSFARYGKDVSLAVQSKLQNTENFFRFCRTHGHRRLNSREDG